MSQDDGDGPTNAQTKVYQEAGDWIVRIGSPDKFLTGEVSYVISYRVSGAITPIAASGAAPEHDELYWNALPTGWATDVELARVSVQLPGLLTGGKSYKARILAGPPGSRWGVEVQPKKAPVGEAKLFNLEVGPAGVSAELKRTLPKGYGMTIVVGIPKGTLRDVPPPRIIGPPKSSSAGTISDNSFEPPTNDGFFGRMFAPVSLLLGLLLPFVGVLGLFGVRWLRKPNLGPLVVRFEPPPGVSAAQAGLLIDGDVDRHDIVAGMIQMAQHGGATLVAGRKSKDLKIELIKPAPTGHFTPFDHEIYDALAAYPSPVTPESLRGTFGGQYRGLAAYLKATAINNGWMRRAGNGIAGCAFAFVTFVLSGIAFFISPCTALLGGVISLIVGIAALSRGESHTQAGYEIQHHLEGLREFITRAHEKELEYMSKVSPSQALFEELLAFAISFQAVKEWSQAFAGMEIEPPTWYQTYDRGDIWTHMLVNDLLYADDHLGSAMTYEPPSTSSYSSGSGFSSGDSGFGGGWSGGDSGSWDSGGGFSGGGDVGGGGGGGGGDSW